MGCPVELAAQPGLTPRLEPTQNEFQLQHQDQPRGSAWLVFFNHLYINLGFRLGLGRGSQLNANSHGLTPSPVGFPQGAGASSCAPQVHGAARDKLYTIMNSD